MNVGDYSTIFAAQIAAAYPKRSTLERSESSAAVRRVEREANGRAALNPVAETAANPPIADENKRRAKTQTDVPYRFWESRVEKPGSASFRESTTPPNDELGKRLDVFC